jgi:hypothetical protein
VNFPLGLQPYGGSPEGPALTRLFDWKSGKTQNLKYFMEDKEMAAPIRRTAKPIQNGKKLGTVKSLSVKTLKANVTLKTF